MLISTNIKFPDGRVQKPPWDSAIHYFYYQATLMCSGLKNTESQSQVHESHHLLQISKGNDDHVPTSVSSAYWHPTSRTENGIQKANKTESETKQLYEGHGDTDRSMSLQ